jgi:phosphocarrier protein HPr
VRTTEVVVSWEKGLHVRPASKLVELARTFRASIVLECGGHIANARSILSILLMCATVGTTLKIAVDGEDEEKALQAVQQVFASHDQ